MPKLCWKQQETTNALHVALPLQAALSKLLRGLDEHGDGVP